MNKATVLNLLHLHRKRIEERFNIKHIALFGSVARDEMREGSDVDVLVEFQGPATFDAYMGLLFYLEETLGCKVDLVTRDEVKPRMRPIIERDLIDVA